MRWLMEAHVPKQAHLPKQNDRGDVAVRLREFIATGRFVPNERLVEADLATVLQANREADWRYYVAVLPVLPAALVIWIFLRALGRLDELQRRIHMQAFGFSLGTTALATFAYGFLEGAGMPHLNWTYVLPLMAVLWAIGAAIFKWRYR